MASQAEAPDQNYRDLLISSEQKSQEHYDRAVLTLSGGALGVSFAFVRDIVGPQCIASPSLLVAAWACWGLSVSSALFSFFFSRMALRRAIRQLDSGAIYQQRPGGLPDVLTAILNASGGLLFLTGLVLIAVFTWYNVR